MMKKILFIAFSIFQSTVFAGNIILTGECKTEGSFNDRMGRTGIRVELHLDKLSLKTSAQVYDNYNSATLPCMGPISENGLARLFCRGHWDASDPNEIAKIVINLDSIRGPVSARLLRSNIWNNEVVTLSCNSQN